MTSTTPPTILVIWHSRTGAARQLADAVCAGIDSRIDEAPTSQTSCRVVRVDRVKAEQADAARVLAASGYVFVMPENLGTMSGLMKEFFDRTYYDVLDRIAGRPYAVVVAAGTDGQGAARQVARIATGWRLRAVAPALVVLNGAQTSAAIAAPKQVAVAALDEAHALGAALAEGLALGIF